MRLPDLRLICVFFRACLCAATICAWCAPPAQAQRNDIELDVDAREAPRRLISVHLTMPVTEGPLTLLYPQWIPGEHGPTGPIVDVVNLKFTAQGQTLAWKRDDTSLYAFHLTIPPHTNLLEVTFQFISPPETDGAPNGLFSAGASMTTQLAVISWNQYVLYPANIPTSQLHYHARLHLPAGWQYATALPVARDNPAGLDFLSATLTSLIDSPVAAGLHVRTYELGIVDGAPHFLHVIADSERSATMPAEWVERYKRLVVEAGALFGVRHYRSYHFLLTLSDHVASFGLEHHESSDDRLQERLLLDDNLLRLHADLLPHEYVHSWNGKYRRPIGLATKDYNEPMKGDLLWIYEGLTEYLGEVLAMRSGLQSIAQFSDYLASTSARLLVETGRTWRPLADTAISAQILYGAREDYGGLRRGVDFYGEAGLLWLEVDTLIRQLSHGQKSLDDFCKRFYAGEVGVPQVNPYRLEDVIALLNSVQPYDWAGLFHDRVELLDKRAPLAGIENAGWKLIYKNKRSDLWAADEEERKSVSLEMSLGLVVKNDGLVQDVVIGGPAQKAGMVPGSRITLVNDRQFSPSAIREALQMAEGGGTEENGTLDLTTKNGEYYSNYRIAYRGGERYPHLEHVGDKTDLLSLIGRSSTQP